MIDIKGFFQEIDRLWTPLGPGKIPLRVIGSGALLLQTDYDRGTKDGDVLESLDLAGEIKERLTALAGKNTDFRKRTGLYLDIVVSGLPLLPQGPRFHPQKALSATLKHFEVSALDAVDVVVSKLKRFNKQDSLDVIAMIERGLVPHRSLITRFESAIDIFSMGSRADDIPQIIKNLHRVERDTFRVPESHIKLPNWMD